MLLNLSNHPFENWSENQKALAKKLYGSVADVPFPQIDPHADEKEISKLAEEFFQICMRELGESRDEKNAVHLMGEFTFVFKLAKKLISNGIEVIASTTERVATESNGKKISEFKFVRFRRYE
jgi:isopentenyldiphosphate isomerase